MSCRVQTVGGGDLCRSSLRLVAKWLSRDPAERFATAWECPPCDVQLEPRALAVDSGDSARLVDEVGRCPGPPEVHETSEAEAGAKPRALDAGHVPRVIVYLRHAVRARTDVAITVTPYVARRGGRSWSRSWTVAAVALGRD